MLGRLAAATMTATVIATVATAAPALADDPVGVTQKQVDAGEVVAEVVLQPLVTNARAKMQGIADGFVKLFISPGSGRLLGGVVVGPRASELIHPVTLAVTERLTADEFANTFTVYPSISGSIAEAARRLHQA